MASGRGIAPPSANSREWRVAVKVCAARIRAIGNSCDRAKIEAAACNGRKAPPKRLIPSRFPISYTRPFRRGDLQTTRAPLFPVLHAYKVFRRDVPGEFPEPITYTAQGMPSPHQTSFWVPRD